MQPSNIRVRTKGFRAVRDADIIINGITVVAGENGCGKSSISKLLYFLYKTVSNYDSLVKRKLYYKLSDVVRFLDILNQELTSNVKNRNQRNEFRREISELRRALYNSQYLEDELESWLTIIEKLESLDLNPRSTDAFENHRFKRLNFIISDILKDDFIDTDLSKSFERIKGFVESKFKEAAGKIKSRPTSVFIEELKAVFSDGDLPDMFDVLEYEEVIVSLTKNNLSIPFNVQNVVYIDTPMMIAVEDSHNSHWNDLNQLLLKKGKGQDRFARLISEEIIQGDVLVEENFYNADEFKFKRKDGAVFNLLDVATGIKSFSILQMLLNNGSLDDKTLLIIDEPESNLHPQWIIEYARIIVLLNKEYGIKFFVASHNPDMVSAIRYVSEKEGNLDLVNFYLATRQGNSYSYIYEHLGDQIDPIFESFNIAIDRIHKYGI